MRVDTSKLHRGRAIKGWTQKKLAQVVGVHESTISRIEMGLSQHPPTIKSICDVLGISIEDVFIDDNEATPA